METIYILPFLALIIVVYGVINYNRGYKQGQIEAINGEIKYEKVTKDGEIIWQEVDE